MTTQSVSCATLDTASTLVADAAAPRVEERLPHDPGAPPPPADVGVPPLLLLDVRRQVRVGDRALDRVAVAAARDPAHDVAADAHGFVAQRDRARVVEHEAAQAPLDRPLVQRGPAEVVLVALDAEAQPRLERRVVGGDVGGPDAVALLQAQRVDRLVAAGNEAVRLAGPP